MQLSNCVQALHRDFAQLALAGKRALSDDQLRSLAYYEAELAFSADPLSFEISRNQIVTWIRFVQAIEGFVAANGRLPRQNNRRPPEEINHHEWVLAEWLRYRQGRAATLGRLCEYQLRRLKCIPGYREHPREATWDERLEEYGHFITEHGRAPRYRSTADRETSLAGWAAKQRFSYRSGTLAPRRIIALTQLEIWTWGKEQTHGSAGPRS